MKNFKFLMPMLAFVMAVGLAFSTPTDAQSHGWIDINGVATQITSDPCTGEGNNCRVTFDDDPLNRVFIVYTDNTLLIPKKSSSAPPYNLPEMPD